MNSNNRFTMAVAVVLALAALGLGLLWWNERRDNDTLASVNDFATCEKAGYPVMESDPRRCRTPDGRSFTEAKKQTPKTDGSSTPAQPELKTREFTSPKGVTIKLNNWAEKPVLSSPATITGEVPGNWSFEANFPVVLTDWDGKIMAQEPAKLSGDWMTTDYVPFTVTLDFDTPTTYKTGALILQKDNPSGLSENADAIEIPVTYK